MKMIVAIIRDNDNEPVSNALINSGFRVTRIASTGGFLRRGSSTLMIGVEDEKVDQAIQLIRNNTTMPDDPGLKRATLFVLNVKEFTQI
ncbi:MAG: cyclic-di-AMP receptor [Anaerolineales bacterium]